MDIVSKEKFQSALLAASAYQENIFNKIQGLVFLVQEAHSLNWNKEKNEVFKVLIQIFHPLLTKTANKYYRFDPLIEKSKPKHSFDQRNAILPEHLVCVLGLFWDLLLKYDAQRGVYFTHYIVKNFDWHYKKLSRTRIRKKKYRDRPNDDYKLVSYEEIIEKKDDTTDHSYGSIRIGEMVYDDNFDLVTSEWSLKEPNEFVENHELFMEASTFTEKQMEVFALELEGYKQEQIADQIKLLGSQITQQGVNERLLGVRKKIEKIQNKRGVSYDREKTSNHPA